MITVLPATEADLQLLSPDGSVQSGMILREEDARQGYLLVSYEADTVVLGDTEAPDYALADGLLRAVLYRALLQGARRAVYRGERDRRWLCTYGFSEEGPYLTVDIETFFAGGCHGEVASVTEKSEK